MDTIPRALFATGASCAANSSLRARVAAADAEAFLNTHLDGEGEAFYFSVVTVKVLLARARANR